MNHLAHFFLSFEDERLLAGNFLADFSLGKRYEQFPTSIQNGVLLHRFIDDFTDHHPMVAKSKLRIAEKHGKYAPVVIDVFYDYLLATDWARYSEELLSDFATNAYDQLDANKVYFPEKLQQRLEHMKTHDWLTNYSTRYGIERTLLGLSNRAKFKNNFATAHQDLFALEDGFRADFNQFFPLVIKECQLFIAQISSNREKIMV